MMVAQVLIESMDLSLKAVKGLGYIRLAFEPRVPHMMANLCVIRPIDLGRGVEIVFEMSPNASMTGLCTKEHIVQIFFDDKTLSFDQLYIKTAADKKRKTYKQTNQKNNMAGLVSLALYQEHLVFPVGFL
jgi:hypothetical protein